jgi:hypothetical protein
MVLQLRYATLDMTTSKTTQGPSTRRGIRRGLAQDDYGERVISESGKLAAEVEGGSEVAAGDGLRLLLPEDFVDFQTFDADLARCFSHPNHASMGAVDAPLQHNHVAGAEVVTGGVDAGAGGRNVKSADVSGASGRDEIDF